MFEILETLIEALSTSVGTAKDRADLHQILGDEFQALQGALDHLILMQTEVGNRGKLIDNQRNRNENLILDQQSLLSRLADTDLSQAVSELTQQLSTLELTQQSYIKIQATLTHLLTR